MGPVKTFLTDQLTISLEVICQAFNQGGYGMRKLRQLFASLLPALLLVALLAGNSAAALKAVGPISPVTTLPTWYQDTTSLALQPCLDQNGFCIMTPLFDPLITVPPNPITTTGPINDANLPNEAFYFLADSTITSPTGVKYVYRAALEFSFLAGVTPGKGITFLRINFKKLSGLTPLSTYTVTHPYGSFTFSTDAGGASLKGTAGQTFRTEDPLGAAAGVYFPPEMAGAVTTGIGPFLIRAGGPIVNADGTYIGDAVTPETVTGGPNGNILRIDGPNAGGPGVDTIQTDLFTLSGKVFTGPIASPMTIDRSTYAFDGTNGQVDLFATALPNASLNLTGVGIPPTTLTQDANNPNNFFAHIPFTGAVPTGLNLANSLDTPNPLAIPHAVNLADELIITQASFNPVSKDLTVKAVSRDTTAPAPTLTVPALALAGIAPNTLDATGTLVTTLPSNPPMNVTLNSSKGGAATSPVSVAIPVGAAVPLAISTASPVASYAVGSGVYNGIITATGGTPPYTFFNPVGGTGMPSGISLFPNGQLFGGGATVPGTYTFNVAVFDSNSGFATKSFTLVVTSGPLAITTATPLPANFIGSGYDGIINATGGTGPYTFSLTAGALPTGISLFSNGQLFGGGATVAGTYNFTVTVTDSTATTASKAFSLDVL
jgi:hypothetical protein